MWCFAQPMPVYTPPKLDGSLILALEDWWFQDEYDYQEPEPCYVDRQARSVHVVESPLLTDRGASSRPGADSDHLTYRHPQWRHSG